MHNHVPLLKEKAKPEIRNHNNGAARSKWIDVARKEIAEDNAKKRLQIHLFLACRGIQPLAEAVQCSAFSNQNAIWLWLKLKCAERQGNQGSFARIWPNPFTLRLRMQTGTFVYNEWSLLWLDGAGNSLLCWRHTHSFPTNAELLRTVDLWPRWICITCHQLTRAPQASGSYTDILVVPVGETVWLIQLASQQVRFDIGN